MEIWKPAVELSQAEQVVIESCKNLRAQAKGLASQAPLPTGTVPRDAGFLAGKVVTIARSLLDVSTHPWIEHEDARYLLGPVNPEENARRKKEGPAANRPKQGLDVPFDPPGALLDALLKRGSHDDGGDR